MALAFGLRSNLRPTGGLGEGNRMRAEARILMVIILSTVIPNEAQRNEESVGIISKQLFLFLPPRLPKNLFPINHTILLNPDAFVLQKLLHHGGRTEVMLAGEHSVSV